MRLHFIARTFVYKSRVGMLTIFLCNRNFFARGQNDRAMQIARYAAAGRPVRDDATGQSHEMFTLIDKDVCSNGVCTLVGFSSTTFTKYKKAREQEIQTDRVHGNTVCL